MKNIKRKVIIVVWVLGAICMGVVLGYSIIGCKVYENDVCTECSPQYFLSTGGCARCPHRCGLCADADNCYTCGFGFYGSDCQYLCSLCQDSLCSPDGCTQGCIEGFYAAVSGGCVQCPSPCITCTENNNCDKCVPSRWGKTCQNNCYFYHCKDNICSPDKAECNNGCEDGYYSNSTTCFVCPVNCKTCTSPKVCGSCKDGKWETACQLQCPDSCTACNKSSGECGSGCANGYYMSTTANVCTPCSAGCSACSSQSVCTSCTHGYVLSGDACVIQCPIGCSICSSPNKCTACSNGYVLSGDACVIQCPVGCSICSSPNKCTACTNGYVLSGDACVIQCPVGCSICSSPNKCTACTNGYVLSGNTCSQCPVECVTCSSQSVCTSCTHGYVLSGDACVIQRPVGCSICSSPNQCTACTNGYVLSGDACLIQCPVGCSICSSPNQCTACTNGYVLSGKTCSQCPVGCVTCSSYNVCTSCTTRYKLLEDVCVIKCPGGCTNCSSTNVCTACSSGYVLSEKLCYPQCPLGCESCSSPSVCSSCINGYVLHTLSNSCVIQCKDGCAECLSAAVCTYCRTGYMLSNSTCVLCPPGWTCNRQDSEMHLVDAEDNSNNVIYGSIGGVLCGIFITLLVGAAIYYFCKRRNRLRENDRNPETPGIPITDFTSTSTEKVSEYEGLDEDRQDADARGNHQRGRLPELGDNSEADYSSASNYEDLVDKTINENQYNVIVQHPYENM